MTSLKVWIDLLLDVQSRKSKGGAKSKKSKNDEEDEEDLTADMVTIVLFFASFSSYSQDVRGQIWKRRLNAKFVMLHCCKFVCRIITHESRKGSQPRLV